MNIPDLISGPVVQHDGTIAGILRIDLHERYKGQLVYLHVDLINQTCTVSCANHPPRALAFTLRFVRVYRQKFQYQNFKPENEISGGCYQRKVRDKMYPAFRWERLRQPYDFFKTDMKIEHARSHAANVKAWIKPPYTVGVKNHPTYGVIFYRKP